MTAWKFFHGNRVFKTNDAVITPEDLARGYYPGDDEQEQFDVSFYTSKKQGTPPH